MSKKKNLAAEAPSTAGTRYILAIETATDVSSVALFDGEKLVALQENHSNRTHARLVTVMIERMLQDVDLRPRDLAAIAVTKGPGSYTGLRVGVSVAKGLCMALDLPLLSVGSLQALAWSVRDVAQAMEAIICPMIDARRMEVFAQLYDAQGIAMGDADAKIVDQDAFQDILAARKMIFVGDGAEKCRPIFAHQPNAIVMGARVSSAAYMGAIAHAQLLQGAVEDLVTFEPFYLKEFVATLSKKKVL